MKLCAACCHELTQESFSKKQWQSKQYQRRCMECIAVNRVVQLKAPPKIRAIEVQDTGNGGISCWICLEEGTDESGQPLVRDCSCRGESAGFGHFSCLVKYAEQKTEQWDGRDFYKFREPWKVCPNCCQDYRNDLSVDLTAEFVTFVEETYPGDQWRHLEALHLKFLVLQGMGLKPKQKEEAKEIASKLLSIVGKMKASNPSLPKRILQIEAGVYNELGCIALGDGAEENVKTAVGYFVKYRDISKAIGCVEGVAVAESNIVTAKFKYEVGNNISNEEYLENKRKWYQQSVATSGEVALKTMTAGINLAVELLDADHGIEAERLISKLAITSKQVHGPEHGITQFIASNLQICKVRYVTINHQHESERFEALRYGEDGKECVVQKPIADSRNIQDEKMVTVATEDIIPDLGIPAVCHGLENVPRLNGKIGDLRSYDEKTDCYEVHFEDRGLEPCSVKRGNIRILFELPDEQDLNVPTISYLEA